MPLGPGTRIGPYEITGSLGAGGMGEVYRARDTRLDRTVAIKVLPEHVAGNPEAKQRFEREARTLAALSHPHICPVYDVGSQEGIDFLVMEHLQGETLEQRLAKGALPLDLALQIAIQVVDALAAAHHAGIVHRDLKPGNIMLTKTGATLLDFGLAKANAPAVAGTLSMLPTTPPNLTVQGTILGTFQYMAPEQLEGQEADARTDVFAFGAVLYEMVTGKKAFEGQSQASLIAAIMGKEPPPVSTDQPSAPPVLVRAVRKCLEKDPAERWQSATDLCDELRWAAETGPEARSTASSSPRRERVAWSLAAVSAVAALALALPALRYSRSAPPDSSPLFLEVSTPATDDPVSFARGLFQVSARGGPATPVTRAIGGQLFGPRWPQFLPDGRRFVFFMSLAPEPIRGVYLGSLDGGEPNRIATAESAGVYISPGMLPLSRQDVLMALPVDADRAVVSGEPVRLAEGIGTDNALGRSALSVSSNGRIAYRGGVAAQWRQLVWTDRTGRVLGTVGPPDDAGVPGSPELSPDERRVAVHSSASINNVDVWFLDVARGVSSRFTSTPATDFNAIWSPDGQRVVFGSNGVGVYDLFEKAADNTGDAKPLLATAEENGPCPGRRTGSTSCM